MRTHWIIHAGEERIPSDMYRFARRRTSLISLLTDVCTTTRPPSSARSTQFHRDMQALSQARAPPLELGPSTSLLSAMQSTAFLVPTALPPSSRGAPRAFVLERPGPSAPASQHAVLRRPARRPNHHQHHQLDHRRQLDHLHAHSASTAVSAHTPGNRSRVTPHRLGVYDASAGRTAIASPIENWRGREGDYRNSNAKYPDDGDEAGDAGYNTGRGANGSGRGRGGGDGSGGGGRGRGRSGRGGDQGGTSGGGAGGNSGGHSKGPLQAAWAAYNSALLHSPLRTKALTAGVLNLAGDAVAQILSAHGGPLVFDLARLARFAVFGTFVAGPLGHFWFGVLENCVSLAGAPGVALKIFLDQVCWTPITLSVFFAAMALMEGHDVHAARLAVQANVFGALVAGWKVWPVVNYFTFAVVPVTQRILFVNTFAIFWVTFLSLATQGPSPPSIPAVTEASACDQIAECSPSTHRS